MITVKEILNLDSLQGGGLVAGGDFINNQVESVNIMDAPDSMHWVRPNELILTTGYPINTNPEDLACLVHMLKEKGCAALGIKMDRYFEIEGSPIIDLANEYGLPIISLPYKSPFSQIISEVMIGMLKYDLDEKTKEIFDEALNEEDLDGFIRTASKLLNGNVSLESHYLENPICYSNGEYSKTLTDAICDERDNNTDYFNSYYFVKNNRVISVNINNFIERHIFPLKFKSETLGVFSLWRENKEPLSNFELITIDYIFPILKFILRENKKKKLVDHKMNSMIGMELINYIPQNKKLFARKIKSSGLDFRSNFKVLTISVKNLNFSKDIAGNDDYNYSYYLSKLNNTISKNTGIKTFIFFYEDNLIVIFYNLNRNNQHELNNIISKIENIVNVSDMFIDNIIGKDLNIGLSKEYQRIERTGNAYQESLIAIEIGREKDAVMNEYIDLGIMKYLYNDNNHKLNSIVEDTIMPILDNKSNLQDLFYTLDVFFKNNENKVQTADELFIHRNTLHYRLNQIKELTGLDINIIPDKLSLYLGVTAYNLLKDPNNNSKI
ncbi:MAG: PucR family transcriptional regulator [Saccharofermentanales bacterium]|jgi:purine catabolism regulator